MHERASEDQIRRYSHVFGTKLESHLTPFELKLIAQLLAEREESDRLRKELSELKDAALSLAREIFRNLAKDLP